MDIPQTAPQSMDDAGIFEDHAGAIYTFTITDSTALYSVAVGIGLAPPATITFSAGSGIGIEPNFGQSEEPKAVKLLNTVIEYRDIPEVFEHVRPGYDPDTIMWSCDRDVTIWGSTVVPAGELMNLDQLATVIVKEDLVFTASLKPMAAGQRPFFVRRVEEKPCR